MLLHLTQIGFLGEMHVFLQLICFGLFGTKRANLYIEINTHIAGSILFKYLLHSHSETMCYMLLLIIQIVFFQGIHVFPQLSWIGLFETKYAFRHLENLKFQEVFLSKTT
jgi:hypothetical protein